MNADPDNEMPSGDAGMHLINQTAFLAAPAPRILIAICSCHRHEERREACRATWLTRLPPHVAAFFFIGTGGNAPPAANTLYLDVADDYAALTKKTASMLRGAVQRWPFDYLFKCDDDTFVAAPRLHELCGHEMCAFLWSNPQKSASGGAGYLLSRALAARLPDEINESGYYEDVEVTLAARRLHAGIVPTPRLRPGHEQYPRPENDLISAHWCAPETLQRIHACWDAGS